MAYFQDDFGQVASNAVDVFTLIVNKRQPKASVQLRSSFINTFGSSSDDADKAQIKSMKTVIFGLRTYPFRFDLDADPPVEDQQMFHDFLFEGFKHRNK